MTDSNTESVCSLNVPKDYSISALDYCTQNELTELNSEKSKVKLKFGVDRLLSKSSDSDRNSSERIPNNNSLGLVLSSHAQQLMSSTSTSFHTQILKPFPLRFGATHNRYSHQSNFFNCNTRKFTLSSNMLNSANCEMNAFQNIIRLPTLSPNHESNQVKDCDKGPHISGASSVKRKRSWSRAVFSNLQRKGLERQFEFQKYITKPDRKKLAARLGLKDAQVKVWFQNRRMKWRHSTRISSVNSSHSPPESLALNGEEEEHFTSSDEDDGDIEIDVVADN